MPTTEKIAESVPTNVQHYTWVCHVVYAEQQSKLQASLKLAIFWNRRPTLTSSGEGVNWQNTMEESLTLELSMRTSEGLKALKKSIKMNDTWIRKSRQKERWPRKMKEIGERHQGESVPWACWLSTLLLDVVVSGWAMFGKWKIESKTSYNKCKSLFLDIWTPHEYPTTLASNISLLRAKHHIAKTEKLYRF